MMWSGVVGMWSGCSLRPLENRSQIEADVQGASKLVAGLRPISAQILQAQEALLAAVPATPDKVKK